VSRRSRIVGFGSAGLLVLAGIACAFAFSGGLAQNLAFVLVALGLVEGTALVFYEVGLTEDHDRAREAERKRAPEPPRGPTSERASERPGRASERPDRSSERPDRASERPERSSEGPDRPDRPERRRLDRMRGRPRRLR
jgi:hypothetical protein